MTLEYRAANLDYPLPWSTRRAPATPTPAAQSRTVTEPSRLVALAILVQVGASSVVMVEPALCDILFPPVFILTLITGHMLSPLRMPRLLLASIGLFILANYASILGARGWGYTGSVIYMAVTIYLLLYVVFLAGFLGKFGESGMRVVRDGYQIAAVIAAVIGILASLRLLPNSEMFFRDASMVRVQSTFKDPNVFAPFLVGAVLLSLPPLLQSRRLELRHLVVIGLSLAGITLASSRGAYVHLVVSLVVFFGIQFAIIQERRTNRRLVGRVMLALPLLVLGIAYLLMTTDLGAYGLERLSLQSYDEQRFSNQLASLAVAHENVWGIGPGQYTGPRFIQDVHNTYLKVLVENGIVGLFAYLAMVATSLFYGLAGVLRRGRFAVLQAAFVAVIVGIMVENLVIDTLHWRHLFLFLGLPVGLTLYERATDRSRAAERSVLPSPAGAS